MNINKNIKRNIQSDRIISTGLYSIYSFLILLVKYSKTNPKWLLETSYSNKKEEVALLIYQGTELLKKYSDRDKDRLCFGLVPTCNP